jgi:hypothetical protein
VAITEIGLPGSPKKQQLPIWPKAKGLPGLIANFQKSTWPISFNIS